MAESLPQGNPQSPPTPSPSAAHILIVDDEAINRRLVRTLLEREGFRVSAAEEGEEALRMIAADPPDLVLLDVLMPGMNGYQVCRRLRGELGLRFLPVVMLTSLHESQERLEGLQAGCNDFITKPFSREELLARVRSLVQQKFLIDELDDAENVILSMAVAIEARDELTEGHTERVSQLAARMGRRLGLSDDDVDALAKGGYLHDIGKLKVPDRILLKAGPLDDEEFEIMKLHTVWGEKICKPLRSVRKVLPIIRHHHERMDGSGYPDGLKGEDIPLLARILAVVDVFDALSSDRPYRRLPLAKTFSILRENGQRAWMDSRLVEEFIKMIEEEGAPEVPPLKPEILALYFPSATVM